MVLMRRWLRVAEFRVLGSEMSDHPEGNAACGQLQLVIAQHGSGVETASQLAVSQTVSPKMHHTYLGSFKQICSGH